MDTLQNILISKRRQLKLSLRKASDLIGISHSYLNNLEKGIDPNTKAPVNPTPETLKLISEAYKIDYNELMIANGYITPNTEIYNHKKINTTSNMVDYYKNLQLMDLISNLSSNNKEDLKTFLYHSKNLTPEQFGGIIKTINALIEAFNNKK